MKEIVVVVAKPSPSTGGSERLWENPNPRELAVLSGIFFLERGLVFGKALERWKAWYGLAS